MSGGIPQNTFKKLEFYYKDVLRDKNFAIGRFPDDFMFQLSDEEYKILKSQIAISSWGGARRANPYAFTEQGVAMLSSVLNSERAIHVNIAIMRAFVRLKAVLTTHKELAHKLNELERKIEKHDEDISSIFEAIRQLMAPPTEKPKRRIGFHSRIKGTCQKGTHFDRRVPK